MRCARRHARGHQLQRCRQRVGLLVDLYSVLEPNFPWGEERSLDPNSHSVFLFPVSSLHRHKTRLRMKISPNLALDKPSTALGTSPRKCWKRANMFAHWDSRKWDQKRLADSGNYWKTRQRSRKYFVNVMLESVIQIKIKMTRTKEYFQFVPNCFLYLLIELNFARWEIENSGCSQPWKSGGRGGGGSRRKRHRWWRHQVVSKIKTVAGAVS